MFDLQAVLPSILPLAITWAQDQSELILQEGETLDDTELRLATWAGVSNIERVRVKIVDRLPRPEHPLLQQAIQQTGLLGPNTSGLTLGHGILLLSGSETIRLLSHELRHVHQYEKSGSIASFLRLYLLELATFGYDDAPLELDAKSFEVGS